MNISFRLSKTVRVYLPVLFVAFGFSVCTVSASSLRLFEELSEQKTLFPLLIDVALMSLMNPPDGKKMASFVSEGIETFNQKIEPLLPRSLNVTLYPLGHSRDSVPEEGAAAPDNPVLSGSSTEWRPLYDELSLDIGVLQEALAMRQQERLQQAGQDGNGQDLERGAYITDAIYNYVVSGTTHELMPLIVNPPSWEEVHRALLDFYKLMSTSESVKLCDPLSTVLTWRLNTMFLTQIPTQETIEGIYQVIRYFQANLNKHSPGRPLVISGIAVGNAIIERAIVERFRKENQNHSFTVTDNLIQLEEGLFLHCSDSFDSNNPNPDLMAYRSEPMLPVAVMDYIDAIGSISARMPEAYILPLASWIPHGEDGWFAKLVRNYPAIAGFIHLKDLLSSGEEHSSCIERHAVDSHSHSRQTRSQTRERFVRESFNLLGWGANDQLQSYSQQEIRLNTGLEVYYPASYHKPTLPRHLLYTASFRKKNFKRIELSKP